MDNASADGFHPDGGILTFHFSLFVFHFFFARVGAKALVSTQKSRPTYPADGSMCVWSVE